MSKHKTSHSSNPQPVQPGVGQDPEALHAAADAPDSTREDRIRQGAFALYQARHGAGGSAEEDWLQAERAVDQGLDLQIA